MNPCPTCNDIGWSQYPCPECHGEGGANTPVDCKTCHGTGQWSSPNGAKVECPTCYGTRLVLRFIPCTYLPCSEGRVTERCRSCWIVGVCVCLLYEEIEPIAIGATVRSQGGSWGGVSWCECSCRQLLAKRIMTGLMTCIWSIGVICLSEHERNDSLSHGSPLAGIFAILKAFSTLIIGKSIQANFANKSVQLTNL